ncbi:MAG TPA: hypothetical protein VFS25_07730 [Chitinophaga sp.]|uniref:hypothetical protein n=1 Tax=Chitinophaga sp. TaxID=1869181 RepID=UPI002DB7B699|nr:hypothetical protein [Chitinophaga sp.]HEU4552707.1 hypothetical protein [Chitinophaga sp.]
MKKSEITVDLGKVHLKGNVQLPENARALVIFAHGSGSSRFSPRNQFVADILNGRRIATLLTDLLTTAEDETYGNRFNIPLLADRLIKITQRVMGIDALPHTCLKNPAPCRQQPILRLNGSTGTWLRWSPGKNNYNQNSGSYVFP